MSFELGYLNDDEIKLLAKETGLSIHAIQEAEKAFVQTHIVSLDTLVNPEDSETTLMDIIPSEDPTPEEEIILKEKKRNLLKIMEETLKARESKVVMMRFGFETGYSMTLQEIGDIYGVTRERIRQIEAKALSKLRRRLKRDGKDEWLVD